MTTIATFQQIGRSDLVKEEMEKIDMIRKIAKDYSEDLDTEMSFQLPRASKKHESQDTLMCASQTKFTLTLGDLKSGNNLLFKVDNPL